MEIALTWESYYTLGLILVLIICLYNEVLRAEFLMVLGVAALLIPGILTPSEAFHGFSHPAMLTVASLFVVASGIYQSGALNFLARILKPDTAGPKTLIFRIMSFSGFFSAFLNNTPIVAMLIPQLQDWCRRNNIAPSRILMPMSYAAIMGGTITLIGTSTNLIVSGMLEDRGHEGLSLFTLAWVGIPATIVVIIFMTFIGFRLLPATDEDSPETKPETLKQYQFEIKIGQGSPFAGKTVLESGFRDLKKAYLAHIRRYGRLVGPVSPNEVLEEGDTLNFFGDLEVMDELLQKEGLERVASPPNISENQEMLPLYEAIVAPSSSLIGKSLKSAGFRQKFQGAVLAVHRGQEKILSGLGRLTIKPGDLLVIEANPGFEERWNGSNEFYLVSPLKRERTEYNHQKALAFGILIVMIGVIALNLVPTVTAAFTAAIIMVLTGTVKREHLRNSINFPVLVIIASALGIGEAVDKTGLAEAGALTLANYSTDIGIVGILIALYIFTNILTELITNNGAAVLMAPLGIAIAGQTGLEPQAAIVVIAIAASASFISPIGYQTNLMVMGPGNYRFSDYFKAGWPLSLIVMSITTTIVYFLWV